MRSKYLLVGLVGMVAGVLLSSVVVVLAGSTDPPAGPTDPASQMFTLEQIYERLNTGATSTKMTTFTEPSSGPLSTMHTLNDIYDRIGERAQVPKTGDAYNDACCTREDGELQKGVVWPNPRFTDNLDGTVTDNLTGLIWLRAADCGGTKTWDNALTWANRLSDGCTDCGGTDNDCGLIDGSSAGEWRVPNLRELQSLVHYGFHDAAVPNKAGTGQWANGDPFTGVQKSRYWSSTTRAGGVATAWHVNFYDGEVRRDGKDAYAYDVWPVRGGQ